MKKGKMFTIFHMVLLMAALQIGRAAVRYVALLLLGRGESADLMMSCLLMLLLAATVMLLSKKQKISLSVFPEKWGIGYTVATVIAAGLLLSSILMQGPSFTAAVGIIYGSAFTPFAEELVFRGYMWNKLKEHFHKDIAVAILTSVLFAIWHLGYADVVAERLNGQNLAFVMMMKSLVGLCYGAVLGAVRMKTKNSYSTMLLHGVMNIFGR